jgi:hypothetical protein
LSQSTRNATSHQNFWKCIMWRSPINPTGFFNRINAFSKGTAPFQNCHQGVVCYEDNQYHQIKETTIIMDVECEIERASFSAPRFISRPIMMTRKRMTSLFFMRTVLDDETLHPFNRERLLLMSLCSNIQIKQRK